MQWSIKLENLRQNDICLNLTRDYEIHEYNLNHESGITRRLPIIELYEYILVK